MIIKYFASVQEIFADFLERGLLCYSKDVSRKMNLFLANVGDLKLSDSLQIRLEYVFLPFEHLKVYSVESRRNTGSAQPPIPQDLPHSCLQESSNHVALDTSLSALLKLSNTRFNITFIYLEIEILHVFITHGPHVDMNHMDSMEAENMAICEGLHSLLHYKMVKKSIVRSQDCMK